MYGTPYSYDRSRQLEEARSVEIERHIDVFEDVNLGPPDNGGG